MIDFRIVPHSIKPNLKVVEILSEGKVVAVIYPAREKGIKLVSAHIKNAMKDKDFADRVIIDDGTNSFPPFPAVHIEFEPCAYSIVGNKIVKHPKG